MLLVSFYFLTVTSDIRRQGSRSKLVTNSIIYRRQQCQSECRKATESKADSRPDSISIMPAIQSIDASMFCWMRL